MKIYIKPLNACIMRKGELFQYSNFFIANKHDIVPSPEQADYILVWTCAFRADHRDASIEKIAYYCKNFTAKVIVAGCLPDIAPEFIKPFGDKIIIVNWKSDTILLDKIFSAKQSLLDFDSFLIENRTCENADTYRKLNPGKSVTFHDQFIKVLISEGCNFKCSYCSERHAFPIYKSFSRVDIKKHIKRVISETGVYDVILLADSLGQYGIDIGSNLPELMKEIISIDSRIKIALNNLHLANFIEFYDEMLFFIRRGVIKHLNLPIQSASNKILKKMNRIYTTKDIRKVFGTLNDMGFKAFDTHVIIGFPTETEQDFRKTVDLLIQYKPQYVLASKYMESESTDSKNIYPKVSDNVVRNRLEKMKLEFQNVGILCNSDDSDLSKDRLRRLHKD